MSIKWCSYCQEFQGEKPPFDQLDISYGMCASCSRKGLLLDDADLDHAKKLSTFQELLWSTGKGEELASAAQLIDQGVQMQIRPIDVLLGLLGPLLYKTGQLWSEGKMTVAEEHHFTAFSESVLGYVEARVQAGNRILFLNAGGNSHTLGARMMALWCTSSGIPARAIYPGLPAQEVPHVIEKFRPEVIGISVSMPEQIPAAQEMIDSIQQLAPNLRPRIVVGGYAVKMGLMTQISGATLIQDPRALIDQIVSQ